MHQVFTSTCPSGLRVRLQQTYHLSHGSIVDANSKLILPRVQSLSSSNGKYYKLLVSMSSCMCCVGVWGSRCWRQQQANIHMTQQAGRCN